MIPETKISIDKGTILTIPIRALQTDPEYFENPMDFYPERFADEEMIHRNQFVNMPFGEGPRQCIGIDYLFCYSTVFLPRYNYMFS